MIQDKIKNGVLFVRKNPIIIFSLLLIVAVATVIFFNTYYSVSKFQNNTDALLHSKAVLAEDIFSAFVVDNFDDNQKTQEIINKVKETDSEVISIDVLKPTQDLENFEIVASSDKQKVGTQTDDDIAFMAWKIPQGIAFLNADKDERFWQVVKTLQTDDEKKGLIAMNISLADNDELIKQSINRMYWVTILSLIIVLLLVANHARLFKYAVRVTKLEEVDKMKDDFISMASHELRMPLTVISGYTDLLQDSMQKDKDRQEPELYQERIHQLKNIASATDRLNDLVNDLLDVSRIEQGRIEVSPDTIDVMQVINDIVDQFSVNAQKKNLKLLVDTEQEEMYIYADKERVRQIIINLVGNAIKYTPKGSVTVQVSKEKKKAKIIVKDTGLGMSADAMKNLFSKFYRIKTDQTQKITGTGLGLWISRELARKMNGDLTAESMENVGSQFILTLPLDE
jgi:signal transduction histidine kinase